MDNGNKIDIDKPEVKLFLQEDLLPARMSAPDLYDLNTEYAKTKSKKISFTAKVLLCCTAVVALLTYGVVFYIQSANSNIKVDIAVFEDLNLKNLLDVVAKTQTKLDQAIKKKNQLEFKLENEIKLVQLEKDSDLQLLDSLRMTALTRKSKEEEINTNFEQQILEINEKYLPQIENLKIQIEDLTAQIASYDSKNVEMAKQQEAAINSQKQAFELEKEAIIAEYDATIENLMDQIEILSTVQFTTQGEAIASLKKQQANELALLDPIFTDEKANEIVSTIIEDILIEEAMQSATEYLTKQPAIEEKSKQPEFIINLSDEEFKTHVEAALSEIEKEFADYNYVTELMASVPWMNSLREYIVAITQMTNEIGTNMILGCIEFLEAQDELLVKEQSYTKSLENEIIELKSNIKNLNREHEETNIILMEYEKVLISLDERARQNGEAGYIINSDDANNIALFISTTHKDSVKDGTSAYVFRESGNLIGTITIKRDGTNIYGVANEEIANILHINDSILLELN